MNPRELFCPNLDCPARGQVGKGNIHVHSQKDRRCICEVCGQTFTTTAGTIFYRLHHAPELVLQVITLLAYGCPIQAIVKAFDLDERTVCEWQKRAGQHCQHVHEHRVEGTQHDLQQVQADEIKVKIQKGTIWMAMAIWVPTRLWMGCVILADRSTFSPKHDTGSDPSLGGQSAQHGAVPSVTGGSGWLSQLRECVSECVPQQVSGGSRAKRDAARWSSGRTLQSCRW